MSSTHVQRVIMGVLGAGLLVGQSLVAQPVAVKQYLDTSMEEFYTCRLRATLELLQRGTAMAGTRACIGQVKQDLGPAYTAARDALPLQSSALPLLKDFYAAWLAGLEALMPAPGESESVYQGRVSALQHKLTEMGHRLRLEAQ